MKFNILNAETAPHVQMPGISRHPANVSFYRNGTIKFAAAAHEAAGISRGVIFLQDKDYPTDYYVAAEDSEQAFSLSGPDLRHRMYTRSSLVVKALSEATGLKPPFSVPMDTTGEIRGGIMCYALKVKRASGIGSRYRE